MNDYAFGNFLYELRTEKGLSQGELGKIMGVSNKAVSKWEMGISKPRPAMLLALAEFFGITVEELLNGKRAETTENAAKTNEELTYAMEMQFKEYRKARRRLIVSIAALLLAPLMLLITIALSGADIESFTGWTYFFIVLSILLFHSSYISIIIFAVQMHKRKQLLYECFPKRTEELKSITRSKRVPERTKGISRIVSVIAIFGLVILTLYLAIRGVDPNVVMAIEFGFVGVLALANYIFVTIRIAKIKRLIQAKDYERAIRKGNWLLKSWLPGGHSVLNDSLRLFIAIAHFSLGDDENFILTLQKISNRKVLSGKSYWQCIFSLSRHDETEFHREYQNVFLPLIKSNTNKNTAIYANILQLVSELVQGTAQPEAKEHLLKILNNPRVRAIIERY